MRNSAPPTTQWSIATVDAEVLRHRADGYRFALMLTARYGFPGSLTPKAASGPPPRGAAPCRVGWPIGAATFTAEVTVMSDSKCRKAAGLDLARREHGRLPIAVEHQQPVEAPG
jgi:hypothetical protein